MKSYSQPILRADGNSIDFLGIEYDNEVEATASGEARVTNLLQGPNAFVLQNLIDKEKAEWVIEVRSPAVLYSRSYPTREKITDVSWDVNETGGHLPVFIISGLVATQELSISAEYVNEIWSDKNTKRHFAQGTYLARGIIYSVQPLLSSMLEFQCDDKASPGTMRIEGPNEHIKFAVYLAKNIYAEIHLRRDVWVAALIGALAKLNREEHDPDESRVLREISLRLNEKGISDWFDDDYDPVAAATCLEPLFPIFEGE